MTISQNIEYGKIKNLFQLYKFLLEKKKVRKEGKGDQISGEREGG